MTALALQVQERGKTFCVCTVVDVVIVLALDGSGSDVAHVSAGARGVSRLATQLGRPVQLLFVLRSQLEKPPSAPVRDAISAAVRTHQALVSRAALVLTGTGFGPAIHRSAVTGILTITNRQAPPRVFSTVPDALAYLLETQAESLPAAIASYTALIEEL